MRIKASKKRAVVVPLYWSPFIPERKVATAAHHTPCLIAQLMQQSTVILGPVRYIKFFIVLFWLKFVQFYNSSICS